MVTSYKATKDKIINTLQINAFKLGVTPDSIIEAGRENVDVMPIPFIYCIFSYGESKVINGYCCGLEIEIYVGCESSSVAEAKEQADEIASRILSLLLSNNLVRINVGEKFKDFFAETSQRAGVVLKLRTDIISHEIL